MSVFTLYRIRPKGTFHFGERGIGIEAAEETFRSDALFSALCAGIREIKGSGALEEFLAGFLNASSTGRQPPVLITSTFPYAGDALLFPRPLLRPALATDSALERDYKRVRWVSRSIFEWLLQGTTIDDEMAGDPLHGGAVLIAKRDRSSLPRQISDRGGRMWSKGVVPRVALDRSDASSAFFRCGLVSFAADCGLFFLARYRDEGPRVIIEEALDCLAEAGMGGERSSGSGAFDWESGETEIGGELVASGREESDIEKDGAGQRFVTLSLYSPTPSEVQTGTVSHLASYDLVNRAGWIGSPEGRTYRRRALRMVAEGSALVGRSRATYGSLVDVTPDVLVAHRVYRYGFAFPIAAREERNG